MMTMMKFLRGALVSTMLIMAPAHLSAQPPQQEGFVPVDQLPGQEELPAAPLLAAAYGVAWAAVLIYLFSIWKRLGRVEREMAEVARRIAAEPRR
jgi:CcmD family protein